MNPRLCIGCGSRHVVGYLFDSPAMLICRQCRDDLLTLCCESGVAMSEDNWLIADLCVASHIVESAWWTYWNFVQQRSGTVMKAVRADKRKGLKRVDPKHPGFDKFFLLPDSTELK